MIVRNLFKSLQRMRVSSWLAFGVMSLSGAVVLPSGSVSAFSYGDQTCDETLSIPLGGIAIGDGVDADVSPDDFELVIVDEYAGYDPSYSARVAVNADGSASYAELCTFVEGSEQTEGVGQYVLVIVPSDASGLDANSLALPTQKFTISNGTVNPPFSTLTVGSSSAGSRIVIEIAGEGDDPYVRFDPSTSEGIVCVQPWVIASIETATPSGPPSCDLLGATADDSGLEFNVDASTLDLEGKTHIELQGSVDSHAGFFAPWASGRAAQTYGMFFFLLSEGIDPVAIFGNTSDGGGGGGSNCPPPASTGVLSGTVTRGGQPVECVFITVGTTDGWYRSEAGVTGSDGGFNITMPSQFETNEGTVAVTAGDYRLYFELHGWSVDDHAYAPSTYVITWDGSAVTHVNGLATADPATLDVALPQSNLIVQISDGTTGVTGANAGVDQLAWDAEVGRWEFVQGNSTWRSPTSGQASSADDGVVGFYLAPPQTGYRLYRLMARPDSTSGLSSRDATFAVAADGTVTTCTSTPESESVTESCGGSLQLDGNGRFQFVLQAGNVTGSVTTPAAVASPWGWVQARSLSQECQEFWSSQCDSGSSTGDTGGFSLSLADGEWRLTFNPGHEDQSAFTATVADITISGGAISSVTEVSGGSVTLNNGVLTVTLGLPNFLAVVTSGGIAVGDAWVSLSTWNTQSGFWEWGQGGSNSQSDGPGTSDDATVGIVGMTLSDQIYRLEINPPWNDTAGLVRREMIIDPAFDSNGSITGVSVCDDIEFDEQQNITCTNPVDLPTADVAGTTRWVLELPGANFTGTVCRPGTGIDQVACTGVRDVWVELQTWNENWMNFEWIGGTNSRSGGAFGLSIATPEVGATVYYQVTANPPWNNPESWTRVSTVLEATESAGNLVLAVCTASGDTPAAKCAETSPVSGSTVFTLRASTQRGTVLSPVDGTAVPNAWVEVFQDDDFGGQQWLSGTQTNRNGQFGLDLAEGSYTLRANPPYQGTSDVTAAEITVVIDANGDVVSPDPFVITLSSPNVVGTVLDGNGNTVQRAWINVEVDNGQYFEWYNAWADTDSSGRFKISLEQGTYRLTINPPERLAGTYSAVREILEVTDSTSIVEPIFVLGSPTLSGRVLAGSTAVAYTHIDVQVFDDFLGQFTWASLWANTGSRGRYAINLDDGRYRLTANPGANAGYSRSNTFVKVVGGTPSLCDDAEDTACTTPIPDGALDLSLASPNVSGTVTYGASEPASRSWINTQRWNDSWGYFEWVDIWAETRSNGAFSMNIDQPGVYRLEFNPNPSIEAQGYTRNEAFIRVEVDNSTLKWCAFADEASARSSTTCNSTFDTSLDVQLRGANFSGALEFNGNAVGDTWVGLETWNPDWNNWEWANGGAQVSRAGRFSMRLSSASGAPELQRLTINPPWNNVNNLGRKNLVIWVGDVNGDQSDDWCYASDPTTAFVDVANSCQSGTATTDGSLTTIQMSGANITGTLKSPDGTSGIRNSHLNVERYEVVAWSREEELQWYDVHANTNSSGAFALNLDEAGRYRVTGWPSWNNPDGYTRGYVEIVVEADGDWCLAAQSSGLTCPSPGTSLEVRLTGSNFQAVLFQDTSFTAGETVRDAWVDVQELVTNGDESFWNWTGGGSPTNVNGLVSLRLDPPDSGTRQFRLSINPPWSGSSAASLSRFTVELTIDSGGNIVTSTPEMTADANGRYQIGFPGTSVIGNVCSTTATADCSGAGIANSWVAVFDSDGNWVDAGTSTNRRGEFRLALDDGTWTLEANPSWENPTGMRTRVTITVSGGQVTGCSNCLGSSINPINIKLSSANVTGTVMMTDSRANSWAWIEVLDDNDVFIDGAPTNQNGNFQISLADGTYVLRMFPNWSLGAAPPMDINVTVAGGVIADWDYAGYSGSDDCGNDASPDTCAITVSFGSTRASSPNVTGTVTLNGDAESGVFIVVRSGLNTTTGSVLSQYTTLSDSSGNFKLKLPNGSYTVSALNPVEGGAPDHQNVTINDNSATVTLTLSAA